MKGIVTINTDAGYYRFDKVGSYAYWIKADGLFLRGCGVFKDNCNSPLEAEMKAIINAVHILLASNYVDITKIIFNRDNIYTKSGKNSKDELQRKLALKISELRKKCGYNGKFPFFEFRHVKAHTTTATARDWVNEWCDQQCKEQLRKWKRENKSRNPETVEKKQSNA